MAVSTVRAGQVTYTHDQDGGTRHPDLVQRDLTPFMDALERRDTPFTNDLHKGSPVNQRRHEWGIRAVTPRSVVLSGSHNTSVTIFTLLAGHTARLQQGHVLRLDNGTNVEHVWVVEPPGETTVVVRRARGGTSAATWGNGTEARVIGIAMPELSDHPLGPISIGTIAFNFPQRFATKLRMDRRARNTPTYEEASDPFAKQMVIKAGDLKLNLEEALILGRRQDGDPDPTAPDPSMMGGLIQFAELSGNVYNQQADPLGIEALDDALYDLDQAFGSNAGSKLLMSLKTKRIFNRLIGKRDVSNTDTSVTLKWDTVTMETGTYKFTHSRYVPDGLIVVYDPKHLSYMPYKGLDWHEEDLPVDGDYDVRAVSGDFTFEAEGLASMALIRNFDMDLSNYPDLFPNTAQAA